MQSQRIKPLIQYLPSQYIVVIKSFNLIVYVNQEDNSYVYGSEFCVVIVSNVTKSLLQQK